MSTPTTSDLLANGQWREIPHCPGRWVRRGASGLGPQDLVGPDVAVQVFHSTVARDPVHVALFDSGGLISYERSDGSFVHTLNDADGLKRKLDQLRMRV